MKYVGCKRNCRGPDELRELESILDRCLAVCGATREELAAKSRDRHVCDAKQLYVYCALYKAERIKKKYKIGSVMDVDPWQVTYYRKKAEFSIRFEPWFKRLVGMFERQKPVKQ